MSFFFVIIKKRASTVEKPACEGSVRTHRWHALRHCLPGDAGDKPGRVLGKRHSEGIRIPAVQLLGGPHKGLQVEIRHSLLRKGYFFSDTWQCSSSLNFILLYYNLTDDICIIYKSKIKDKYFL